MTLKSERDGLYAAMNRYGDMLHSLIGPDDQMEQFLSSYAAAKDYWTLQQQAVDERDPVVLHRLVGEMNAALDRWGR